MALNVAIAVLVVLIAFFGFVSTREGKFKYQRSGLIASPPEKVFAFVSDFRKGQLWSPFAKADPGMKTAYSGEPGTSGATMEFEGNSKVGSGRLEMVSVIPNELVQIKLIMIKPFRAENLVEYRLAPEAGGTRFTWTMSGDGGFFGKLMNVFIDCDKMMGGQFDEGIANLKTLCESR